MKKIKYVLVFLLASILAGCGTSPQQQSNLDQLSNKINALIPVAQTGNRDAAYEVCTNTYQLVRMTENESNGDIAWYWCSNLAKENYAYPQYLTGRLLERYNFTYRRQIWKQYGTIGQDYLEALYWYRMAIKNGFKDAEDNYQSLLKHYNSNYGSGRSDLLGKIVAGAFIAGVANSAGASNALTAKAVSAFAADAATDGRANASASFLMNAGPSQLSPPLVKEPMKPAPQSAVVPTAPAKIAQTSVHLQKTSQNTSAQTDPIPTKKESSSQSAKGNSANQKSSAASKPQNATAAAENQAGIAGSGSAVGKDIYEPRPDFGGKAWLNGGGEGTRRPVTSRTEACQQAERDREAQISIDARDRSDRGIEKRSPCACSYSARYNTWFCSVWYLRKGTANATSSDR